LTNAQSLRNYKIARYPFW